MTSALGPLCALPCGLAFLASRNMNEWSLGPPCPWRWQLRSRSALPIWKRAIASGTSLVTPISQRVGGFDSFYMSPPDLARSPDSRPCASISPALRSARTLLVSRRGRAWLLPPEPAQHGEQHAWGKQDLEYEVAHALVSASLMNRRTAIREGKPSRPSAQEQSGGCAYLSPIDR